MSEGQLRGTGCLQGRGWHSGKSIYKGPEARGTQGAGGQGVKVKAAEVRLQGEHTLRTTLRISTFPRAGRHVIRFGN